MTDFSERPAVSIARIQKLNQESLQAAPVASYPLLLLLIVVLQIFGNPLWSRDCGFLRARYFLEHAVCCNGRIWFCSKMFYRKKYRFQVSFFRYRTDYGCRTEISCLQDSVLRKIQFPAIPDLLIVAVGSVSVL